MKPAPYALAVSALALAFAFYFTPNERYHAVVVPERQVVVVIDGLTGEHHATCWFAESTQSFSDCRK